MIHCGIGESHLNAIMSTINIPTINSKSLKQREREVGRGMEMVAGESVEDAMRREIEMTSKSKYVFGIVFNKKIHPTKKNNRKTK